MHVEIGLEHPEGVQETPVLNHWRKALNTYRTARQAGRRQAEAVACYVRTLLLFGTVYINRCPSP